MTGLEWLVDVTVMVTLVVLAGGALHGRNLFRSIVLFIAFGLVLSLAWIRLQAPGVALAETIIGAGVTGALLLVTAAYMGHRVAKGNAGHKNHEEETPRE